MHPKEFSIVVDIPEGGFYTPGETLRGKVLISLEKRHPFQTLHIVLLGRARNSWWEKEDAGPQLVERTEEYLNFEAEMSIEGSKAIDKAEYGFEYQLAEGLPSSFSSQYGALTYLAKALLVGEKDSEMASTEFKIAAQLNLDEFPAIGAPATLNLSQPLLFESGELQMKLNVSKSGFVTGDKVVIQSRFSNGSQQEVHVNLYFMMETVYLAKDQRIMDTQILVSVEGPSLQPLENEAWNGELLEIPSLPCTPFPYLQNCHIIQVRFYLTFEMEIPIPNINLEGKVPLIIGTIAPNAVFKDVGSSDLRKFEIPLTSALPQYHTQNTAGKKLKSKPRSQRPLTTCLVFRPDRPRLQLPEPKPELWKKPKVDKRRDEKDNNADIEDMFKKMNVQSKTETNEMSPPETPPPTTNGTDKPKWPKHYIRKRHKAKVQEIPESAESSEASVDSNAPSKTSKAQTMQTTSSTSAVHYFNGSI